MHHYSGLLTRTVESWFTAVFFAAETQSVIAMRLLGGVGLWPVARDELGRAALEKLPALSESWFDMQRALWRGAAPDDAMAAFVAPMRRKVRDNRQRLLAPGTENAAGN